MKDSLSSAVAVALWGAIILVVLLAVSPLAMLYVFIFAVAWIVWGIVLPLARATLNLARQAFRVTVRKTR